MAAVEGSITDVSWDGSLFRANTEGEKIVGRGRFKSNKNSTGGVIVGTVLHGPQNFVNHLIAISFNGSDGTYVIS